MSLLERMGTAQATKQAQKLVEQGIDPGNVVPPKPQVSAREASLIEMKRRMTAEVVEAWASLIDLSNVDAVRAKIVQIVNDSSEVISDEIGIRMTRDERARLIEETVHEIVGFGPIEPLLGDESITEVMVNGPKNVYIERAGKITKTEVRFRDTDHLMNVIDRIITPIGRRVDETSPRVDARLPDGSRVNVIIPPLSLIGPIVTVRKFATRFDVEDLIRMGTATREMFEFLQACVEARLNIFLSGSTGSGKTTTLNVISSFIPEGERIVTVEDSAELLLSQNHVITLESRPPNLEDKGEITIRDLLRNSLHMRPDRIIVGECRSGEALDMIQAMTTGHEGSLSTGHSNSPKDMLSRLETMVLMTGYELPLRAIREQIASAVDIIVHTARLKDGSRKIVSITEVYGIEDDDILTQEIFTFEQTGVDQDGRIQGSLKPTGVRPLFMDSFAIRGVTLPPGEFGIPPATEAKMPTRGGKARWAATGTKDESKKIPAGLGRGRVAKAAGMVYISSVGPVDPESGMIPQTDIRGQTQQCLANLQRLLGEMGSSLEKVVWANWAIRDRTEFDAFNEEWLKWFPGDAPVGQETLMPTSHRRAGFRVSVGVIAEEDVAQRRPANDRLQALLMASQPGGGGEPAAGSESEGPATDGFAPMSVSGEEAAANGRANGAGNGAPAPAQAPDTVPSNPAIPPQQGDPA